MEVELKLEPGRQEPKVVILAGEDSPSLERLRAHLSGLSLGPITVWRGERALPVRQEEFLRFFADGKGVSAQTAEQTYPVRLRLYELEERLAGTEFVRASKQMLVNFDHVASIRPALNARLQLMLDNGEAVIVSRQYAPVIKRKLGL